MKKTSIILLLSALVAGCSSVSSPGGHHSPLSALLSPQLLSASQTPNDPLYAQQGYLNTTNVPQAWQVTHGSANQKMAVIAMGGINKNHEDLTSRVTIKRAAASAFANNGAADQEAGIMGAATNNGKGIAGVNWSAPLLSYNIGKKITATAHRLPNGFPVHNPETFIGLDKGAVGPAINNAVNAGAKAILLPIIWMQNSHIPDIKLDTLQVYPSFKVKTPSLMLIFKDVENIIKSIFAAHKENSNYKAAVSAVKNAYKQGSVVVAMPPVYAGTITGFPGDLSSDHLVFTVGAYDAANFKPFQYSGTPEGDNTSSNPNDINVIAPGVKMETTLAGDHAYGKVTGTAPAAALATGIISLMQSADGDLTPDDIRHILQKTAVPVGGGGYHKKSGYGLIDAGAALNYVQNHTIKHGTMTASDARIERIDSHRSITLYSLSTWGAFGSGFYSADIDKVTFTIPLVPSVSNDLWYDVNGTPGWSAANPNDENRYAQVKLYDDHATVTTYIYNLSNSAGASFGWYPAGPDNIQLSYSYVGEKRSTPPPPDFEITGPDVLNNAQYGTWGAYFGPNADKKSLSYIWYEKDIDGHPNTWEAAGTGSTLYFGFYNLNSDVPKDAHIKLTVSRGGQSITHYLRVSINPQGAGSPPPCSDIVKSDSLSPNSLPPPGGGC